MKILQKIFLLFFAILIIAIFLRWWMSYEPMEIILKNEGGENVSINITLTNTFGDEILNKSVLLRANSTDSIKNITNLAGSYYVNVVIPSKNISAERKIKYGKYYEKIEIIIKNEIEIKNERA